MRTDHRHACVQLRRSTNPAATGTLSAQSGQAQHAALTPKRNRHYYNGLFELTECWLLLTRCTSRTAVDRSNHPSIRLEDWVSTFNAGVQGLGKVQQPRLILLRIHDGSGRTSMGIVTRLSRASIQDGQEVRLYNAGMVSDIPMLAMTWRAQPRNRVAGLSGCRQHMLPPFRHSCTTSAPSRRANPVDRCLLNFARLDHPRLPVTLHVGDLGQQSQCSISNRISEEPTAWAYRRRHLKVCIAKHQRKHVQPERSNVPASKVYFERFN